MVIVRGIVINPPNRPGADNEQSDTTNAKGTAKKRKPQYQTIRKLKVYSDMLKSTYVLPKGTRHVGRAIAILVS